MLSRDQAAIDRARSLQYSRAMNILRSPGLAAESGDQIYKALQELHPKEEGHSIDSTTPRSDYSAVSLHFITGQWCRKQIQRSRRGTAVDQWGWDSKEMLLSLTSDSELMDDVAETWALPVAIGLPSSTLQRTSSWRSSCSPLKTTQAWSAPHLYQ
jgi:hypothetical protein